MDSVLTHFFEFGTSFPSKAATVTNQDKENKNSSFWSMLLQDEYGGTPLIFYVFFLLSVLEALKNNQQKF